MLIIEQLSATNNNFTHQDITANIENEDELNELNDAVFAANALKTYLKDSVRVLTSFYDSSVIIRNIDGLDDILTTFKWFLDNEEPILIKDEDVKKLMKPSSICEMFNISHRQLYKEIFTLYNIRKDSLIHQMSNEIEKYRKEKGYKSLNKTDVIDELYDIYEVYFFEDFDKSVEEDMLKEIWIYYNSREARLKQKNINLNNTRKKKQETNEKELEKIVNIKNEYGSFLSVIIASKSFNIKNMNKRNRAKKRSL